MLGAIETAYQGTVVGQTYRVNQVVDVAVILDPDLRCDPETVGSLLLRAPDGTKVPVRAVAEAFMTSGCHVVLHDGTRRRQAVTCNVRGRDVASFVAEARRRIASQVALPAGTYVEFTGAAEARAQTQRELLLNAGLAALGILVLLSVVFRRGANLLLVLANLPFALVGGVLAAFLTGGQLSIRSLVRFVTLFGITTRNSIMLVSHFEHLIAQEDMGGPESAERGAAELGARAQRARTRDRGTHGRGDPRRAGHLDRPQPARPPLPGAPVRAVLGPFTVACHGGHRN